MGTRTRVRVKEAHVRWQRGVQGKTENRKEKDGVGNESLASFTRLDLTRPFFGKIS
jgi:hypothetical protein